jgi:NADH-quinone oxidoreductase subunit J
VTLEFLIFFFVAAAAVTTALLMVLQRNPVMSAIFLIANFFCLAALYLLLHAQLLAVLQVVVYAGAIMVLVIFVIMLLNLGDERALAERLNLRPIAAVIVSAALLVELLLVFAEIAWNDSPPAVSAGAARVGSVEGMGEALFGKFLLPFEVTSLLLLGAIVGAVVLARRAPDGPRRTP